MPRTKGETLVLGCDFGVILSQVRFRHPSESLGIKSWSKMTVSLCSGLVPLHNACSYGHFEVAELLVRHGASVNVADLWKFTPLHEAAAKGKYEICKLLLKVCLFLNTMLMFLYI